MTARISASDEPVLRLNSSSAQENQEKDALHLVDVQCQHLNLEGLLEVQLVKTSLTFPDFDPKLGEHC